MQVQPKRSSKVTSKVSPQALTYPDPTTSLGSSRLKVKSSWIEDIKYKRTDDGKGWIAVFLMVQDRKDEPVALLYSSDDLPSWLPGLIQAGFGGVSVGAAYNKLLKSKGYAYQKVQGWTQINQLKKMMK